MKLDDFKFRVWDKKNKSYCINNTIFLGSDGCIYAWKEPFVELQYLEKGFFEIELFTGIYLKGGQGIFENDLIIGKTGDEVGEPYQIVYDAKKAFFMAVHIKNKIQIPLSNLLSEAVFEIAGNIHEKNSKEQGC